MMADDEDPTFDANEIDAEIACLLEDFGKVDERVGYAEMADWVERDLIRTCDLGLDSPDPIFWREVIAELRRRAL